MAYLEETKKITLPLVALLLALLMGEGLVRFMGLAEWGGGQGPNQPSFRLAIYRMNSQGFRGPEIVPADLRKKKVILGLGDSFTFGQGVKWKETFLQQLESLIHDQTKTRCKTINAAKPGWNTLKQGNYFSTKGITYNPNILIHQFTLNDPEIGTYYLRQLTPFSWERTLWRSHFFFYLVRVYNTTRFPFEDYIKSLYVEDSEEWRYFEQVMGQMGAICRSRGIQPFLVIYPILQDQELGQYDFAPLHEKVAAVGKKSGYEVIDLLPFYKKYPEPTKTLRVSAGDWHPNAKGHAIAAQAVFERLKNKI